MNELLEFASAQFVDAPDGVVTDFIPAPMLDELRRLQRDMDALTATRDGLLRAFMWGRGLSLDGANIHFDIDQGVYTVTPLAEPDV